MLFRVPNPLPGPQILPPVGEWFSESKIRCPDFALRITTFPSKRHCRATSCRSKVDQQEDPLSCQEKQTFVILTD